MENLSRLRLFCVFVVAMMTALPLFGQDSASLSGTVTDADGTPLPGVTIEMSGAAADQPRTSITNAEGVYTFTALVPGTYQVTATLDGFASGTSEVALAADQSASQDFALESTWFFNSITVTADKREQEILDVPASITAVTGESIENQGVTNLTDIQGSIPGLSVVDSGAGSQRTQIRGISSPQNLPTVGIYLDEMPITSEAAGSAVDIRLLDLERVEVLRGPQGTLYGESSMGGTIKYVTKDPLLDATGFSFDSAYGSTTDGGDTYRASAVVNLPVTSNRFGLRLLAGTETYPGWIDYPAQGREDGNEGDSTTVRLKALWTATDRFDASLMLQHQDTSFDDQNFTDLDRTAPFVLPQPIEQESMTANLLLNYNFGAFSLLSSTGYIDSEGSSSFDFTALYAPIFPPGLIETVALNAGGETEVLTQELRLSSNGANDLDWTVGAYYRDFENSNFNLTETITNPFPFELFDATSEDETRQTAVFGEVDYAISERFSTTVGLRYFEDKRERSSSSGQFGPAAQLPDQSGTYSATSPRLVLSYKPSDDSLIYASASKGFRSGGFNLVPPGCDLPITFDPEDLWTYELGSSASTKTGKFVVQGAIYYNDWDEIQTLALCPGTFISLTDNIGKANGPGIDLQFTITPMRELVFTITGGYNDLTFDGGSLVANDGDRVAYASEYNYSAAADWSFDWGENLPGRLHVDYQVVGPFDIPFRNFGAGVLSSDELGLLNAKLGLTVGGMQLSIWGQNLLDDDGSVSPAIPFGGVPSAVRPRSRTVGVGLGFSM